MRNDSIKKFLLYIRYPYTAFIIAIMWIGMCIIIIKQEGENLETLIGITAFCSLYIAYKGFRKQ